MDGQIFFYILNLQGDVVRIVDSWGRTQATYTYNAWGKLLNTTTTSVSNAANVANKNPLRYRGYYYDAESKLYYLQSRYYDPYQGRFINPDAFTSTGQGLLGNNMYAYCGNNPVSNADAAGCRHEACYSLFGKDDGDGRIDLLTAIETIIFYEMRRINNNIYNTDEQAVLGARFFSFYKGALVIRTNGNRSGSFGVIF